jgi:hypothetical protein
LHQKWHFFQKLKSGLSNFSGQSRIYRKIRLI